METSRHSKVWIIGIIFSVLVLMAASFYSAYYWQHTQVNDLNGKIDTLNSKIVSLNAQCSALQQPSMPVITCPSYEYVSTKGVHMTVYSPIKDSSVTSPIGVIGKVPGNWSFEAQFPVVLKNVSGAVIARATGTVLGNWQTDQPVSFSAQLIYTGSKSGRGVIVLQKDNPSGDASRDDSVSIPITFSE